MTRVSLSWASCGVRASKGTRGSDDDAVSEGLRSLYPVMGVVCHPEKTGATRGVRAIVSGDRIDHVEAR